MFIVGNNYEITFNTGIKTTVSAIGPDDALRVGNEMIEHWPLGGSIPTSITGLLLTKLDVPIASHEAGILVVSLIFVDKDTPLKLILSVDVPDFDNSFVRLYNLDRNDIHLGAVHRTSPGHYDIEMANIPAGVGSYPVAIELEKTGYVFTPEVKVLSVDVI